MDEIAPAKMLKEENEYVLATYDLANAVVAHDLEVHKWRNQVIQYPMDQVAYRRYFSRKAKVIREFTLMMFPKTPGGPSGTAS